MRIVIADDHPIVSTGVRSTLKSLSFAQIYGEAKNSKELIQLITQHKPDLVITDYHMPSDSSFGDGDRLLMYLKRNFPDLKILVLTMTSNPLIISSIVSCDVDGVLLKTEGLSDLCTAIQAIRNNQPYVNKTIAEMLNGITQLNHDGNDLLSSLTPKESEVLRLYINGSTITEIAQILHRSIKTISAQKNHALKKLGVANEKDLFKYAIKFGLL